MAYYHQDLVNDLKSKLEDEWPDLKLLFDPNPDANVTYYVRNKVSHVVAEFSVDGIYRTTIKLQENAGCCGALTLYEWNVSEKLRGRGIATALLNLCEEVAIKSRYTFLTATDNKEGLTEKSARGAYRILRKNGWSVMCKFKSDRTLNTIWVFCKSVHPKIKSIYAT